MTEFKKGDKVTHEDSEFWPGEYTLLDDAVNSTVEVRSRDGHSFYFTVSRLTKIEESGPKVGDRVRLVHEGVVTATTGRGLGRAIEIDGEARILGKGETVEILERAPKAYPVGTAVRYKTPGVAYPLLRDRDGWRNHAGERVYTMTDARVHGGEFEVLYEPPQSA